MGINSFYFISFYCGLLSPTIWILRLKPAQKGNKTRKREITNDKETPTTTYTKQQQQRKKGDEW